MVLGGGDVCGEWEGMGDMVWGGGRCVGSGWET